MIVWPTGNIAHLLDAILSVGIFLPIGGLMEKDFMDDEMEFKVNGKTFEMEDDMEGDDIDEKTAMHAKHEGMEELTVREFKAMMASEEPMEYMLKLKAEKAAKMADKAKKYMEGKNAAKPRISIKKYKRK